jgi:hypothetical protein
LPKEKWIAGAWGLAFTALLALLIVAGSRSLDHFDAALVGYTFATLFATFGITYRYAMWLQRPPTRLYWRRGWSVFLTPHYIGTNLLTGVRRLTLSFAANAFIFKRGRLRGTAHWLIMWGCVIAAAITFPLVWGWVHFETVPGHFDLYQTYVFGVPLQVFPVESFFAFLIFHGLVWSAFLVIAGVMIAFRRRMIDHAAVSVQQFAQDVMPLILLFAISVTGLMLTASYTWMKGYGYEFLALLHAITVIATLLYLPFGKLFHIFQRPAQIGVSFYKDAAARGGLLACRRCGRPTIAAAMVSDLIQVERELGFRYEMNPADPSRRSGGGTEPEHYQQICPACRRALFGLAQARQWSPVLIERGGAE